METFAPRNAFYVRHGKAASPLFDFDLVEPDRKWRNLKQWRNRAENGQKSLGWLRGLSTPQEKKMIEEEMERTLHSWANRMRLAFLHSMSDTSSTPHVLCKDILYYLITRFLRTVDLLIPSTDKVHYRAGSELMVVGVQCPAVAFILSRKPASSMSKHKKSSCEFCQTGCVPTPCSTHVALDPDDYRHASLHHLNYFWQGFDGLLDLIFVDSTLKVRTSENTVFDFTTNDFSFPTRQFSGSQRLDPVLYVESAEFERIFFGIKFALAKIENVSFHSPGGTCSLSGMSFPLRNGTEYESTSLRIFVRGDNGFRLVVGDKFAISDIN